MIGSRKWRHRTFLELSVGWLILYFADLTSLSPLTSWMGISSPSDWTLGLGRLNAIRNLSTNRGVADY